MAFKNFISIVLVVISLAATGLAQTGCDQQSSYFNDLLGSFDGSLCDNAPATSTQNSTLVWNLNSTQNVSWTAPPGVPVNLLLCSDLTGDSETDNTTVLYNNTSSSFAWNVSISGLRMPNDTFVKPNEFYFILQNANSSFELARSQNFTIPNAASILDPPPAPAAATSTPTTSPPGSLQKEPASGKGLSVGAIVGIAVGATAAVALLLLAATIVFCMRRRRAKAAAVAAGRAGSQGPEAAMIHRPSVPTPETALHSNPPSAPQSTMSRSSGQSTERPWPLTDALPG